MSIFEHFQKDSNDLQRKKNVMEDAMNVHVLLGRQAFREDRLAVLWGVSPPPLRSSAQDSGALIASESLAL